MGKVEGKCALLEEKGVGESTLFSSLDLQELVISLELDIEDSIILDQVAAADDDLLDNLPIHRNELDVHKPIPKLYPHQLILNLIQIYIVYLVDRLIVIDCQLDPLQLVGTDDLVLGLVVDGLARLEDIFLVPLLGFDGELASQVVYYLVGADVVDACVGSCLLVGLEGLSTQGDVLD